MSDTTTMYFPKATSYYHANPLMDIGDAAIDHTIQLPIFHFGRQPVGLKDVDQGKKIAVLGCGSAYDLFSSTALKHRGTTCYIIDPAGREEIEKRLERPLDPEREILVRDISQLPADIDYAAILTPPQFHADIAQKFLQRDIPVMIEKPIVSNGAQINSFETQLEQNGNAPIYAMDWEVALATPLMAALGLRPSFEGIVEYSEGGKDAFASFDLNQVTRIETTFLEGGNNPLCGPQDRGGWLWDISKGGGGLYDMGVHALNTLAVLGFSPEVESIGEVVLGAPNFGGTKGVYPAVGANSHDENGRPQSEMYARAELHSSRDGRSVPTMLECGKGGYANDMRITMIDSAGKVLDWQYGEDKSIVTLKDKTGQLIATAQSHIDPYALMYEEATRFFQRERAVRQADPDNYAPTALYYDEHRAVLRALDAIQAKGRSSSVEPSAQVAQKLVGEMALPFASRVPAPRDPMRVDGTSRAAGQN